MQKYQIQFPEVKTLRICNVDGTLENNELISKNINDSTLLKAYELMLLSRQMDELNLQYQRQGRMLTFPPSMGQEAIQVSVGLVGDRKNDWFSLSYRRQAADLTLGKDIETIYKYWLGNEYGSQVPKDLNLLPINVLIATQFSHAVGIALANKIKNSNAITWTDIGDGGSSQGEFYAAMNWASVHKLRVIFIVQNNQFAISTSKKWQTHSQTFAQKGLAAGIESYKVDGNDFLACYSLLDYLTKSLRENPRPVLIEAETYRIGPHTTADDPSLYMTKEYHEQMIKLDPIIRLEKYLTTKNILDQDRIEKIKTENMTKIKEGYEKAIANNEVSIDEIFDHTFASLPKHIRKQKEELKKLLKKVEEYND
ncbi:MAG: pyruvate dehydrogenase (acetyl-transferring) E1 component subunit alpha [Mycoplasma sp.]|nr:pyruvate dehydrogenase (acetyl-transferring) E1 component subunit alpha [Mycoplasma sp.]